MNQLVQQATQLMRSISASGVVQAEATMLSYPQAQCPVIHHFGPGVYIREVHMPAGVMAIGHTQRYEHTNVLLKGKVLMLQEDGSTREVTAPAMYFGKPGRKIGWVLEDVVWQNIYATNIRDAQEAENFFLDKSEYWRTATTESFELSKLMRHRDREDFLRVLREYGFSEDTVWAVSVNPDDQIHMPQGSWRFKLGQSPIHGTGVFATDRMRDGDIVGPARLGGMRTPLGRYTNHSSSPNARMVLTPSGDVILVITRTVQGCAGGLDGEELTIDYRQALELSGITKRSHA